jgi:drug/metabolite transporter (DMT)-like permease
MKEVFISRQWSARWELESGNFAADIKGWSAVASWMSPYPVIEPAVHRRAVFWLIAATAAWGLSFPVQKMLTLVQQEMVPAAGTWFLTSWIICLRSLMAAVVLLCWKPALLRGMTREECRQGLLLGMIGGMGLMLQADGLAYTEASTSAFLTQAYCVILPVWHCLSRRQAPTWQLIASTVMVLWGISILSGFNWRTLHIGRGEWETLAAAGTFTFQIILLERPRYQKNRPMPVTVLMFAGFAAWSAPVAVSNAPQLADLWHVLAAPSVLGLLTVLALACTVFAYGIMNLWQPKVTATEAGLIYCIEPVCAAFYALFLPGLFSLWTQVSYANEALTPTLISGGLLITLANVLLQLKFSKPPPPVTANC